jgi:hypothetical protein
MGRNLDCLTISKAAKSNVEGLGFASGSGLVARRILGSTVIGGMTAASAVAIFLIPVMFYVVEKLAAKKISGCAAITTSGV